MTNQVLQAIIDEYGERICAIFIDNEHKLLFNYPNTPKITDIELVNIGGVDMYKVPYEGKSQRPPVKFSGLYLTSCIQQFIIIDEKDINYRVDPMIFR